MKRLCIAAALTAASFLPVQASEVKIVNDAFRHTVDGKPIYSQGGGIWRFGDRWYWYGAHYDEADRYYNDPTVTCNPKTTTFREVTLYVSDNLADWTEMPPVVTRGYMEQFAPVNWMGRLGVAYMPEAGIYAMLVQYNGKLLVLVADSPEGPFAYDHETDMTPLIGTTCNGDQTVFTDPDTGLSYLVYCNNEPRDIQYVSPIVMKDGHPELDGCIEVCRGESREGNCMFKYKGRYYFTGSNVYGWDGSPAYYTVAEDITGPWKAEAMSMMEGCADDYSHVSQTGFYVNVPGTDGATVIFCGDRWAEFAGNGLGYNQWMPLTFDAEDRPVFNSVERWWLDPAKGSWHPDQETNLVRNGSFEADRRQVPLDRKPRQEQLTGWTTEVIMGNAISLDNPDSPRINYDNSREDRRFATGEKSLLITDTKPFVRTVTQTIPNVQNGDYTLSLKLLNRGGFDSLKAVVVTASGREVFDLRDDSTGNWRKESFNLPLPAGDVTITINAEGQADALAVIDDIELRQRQ